MHETVGKFRVLENSKLNLIPFFDAPAKVVEQFVDTAFACDWISVISVIPISIVKVYDKESFQYYTGEISVDFSLKLCIITISGYTE